MFPNFLIIGSEKAGTTSLYHILKEHPQIFMADKKEINFFIKDDEYARGPKAYAEHFTDSATQLARGEASPSYLCHPDAAARIHSLLPNIKLILTIRNPTTRAISQYWDNRLRLNESQTFAQVVNNYFDDKEHPTQSDYFSCGVYLRYIHNYLEYFPRENLLILPFEEMVASPEVFYKRIFTFLGVDADFQSEDFDEDFNQSTIWKNPFYQMLIRRPRYQEKIPARLRRFFYWGGKTHFSAPPIDETSRKKLEGFYSPSNDELREFLGMDLKAWGGFDHS